MSTRNKVMRDLYSNITKICAGWGEPSLEGITMRSMKMGRIECDVTADGRQTNWRTMCLRCGGTGVLTQQWAIKNQHTHKGNLDCFSGCQQGWFRLPSPGQYQRAIMVWMVDKIAAGKQEEVVRVATSEVHFLDHIWGDARPEGTYEYQMFTWWDTVMVILGNDGGLERLKEGLRKNKADVMWSRWKRRSNLLEWERYGYTPEMIAFLQDMCS